MSENNPIVEAVARTIADALALNYGAHLHGAARAIITVHLAALEAEGYMLVKPSFRPELLDSMNGDYLRDEPDE